MHGKSPADDAAVTVVTPREPPAAAPSAAPAEPIWFASYPRGIPRTIDPDSYPSLAAMLIGACKAHAARPAFECLGVRMSYADWDRDSRDFAAFLIEALQCSPEERVAIMLPNMFAYPGEDKEQP